DWREAGLSNAVRRVKSFEVVSSRPDEIVLRTVTVSGDADGYRLSTLWTVHGDGTIGMDNTFEPFGSLPLLPRIGVVLRLGESFENVRWLGRGPWENYPDREDGANIGVWSNTVAGDYFPYVRPQETGSREDVRWVKLTDGSGRGLKIGTGAQPFAFSALHFTADDLASYRHTYELKPRREVILSLDAKQGGLGNSSAGPGVLEKFAVRPGRYRLSLIFSPLHD
ncbi:MAG TPA: beta-galactosidase small subunit, partial [Verrucomicrobiae bacterium]|nr:beta-galactosidase small subunit [Verrucomicrobiae bacterium]